MLKTTGNKRKKMRYKLNLKKPTYEEEERRKGLNGLIIVEKVESSSENQ
jgi:hypothetical protein